LLDEHDPARTFKLEGDVKERFELLSKRVKRQLILEAVGKNALNRAGKWVQLFNEALRECLNALGLRGALLSKELKSFVEDPVTHLEKKLFIYFFDLLRRRISLEGFREKGHAAVTTSLMTNLRSIYQNWALLSLWTLLAKEYGAEVSYPEHGYLHLERLGRQRLGEINPNLILRLAGRGSLSFFLEVPRPVSWEDTSDLVKAWDLYTALRPDIMVCGGFITNLIDLSQTPPIHQPDMIIECKELVDWYERVRDVKGPFAKPLTVEEWRSKWITGLYEGLADVLGVSPSKAAKKVAEQRGLRLREDRVVVLYHSIYRPKAMYLISRAKTPGDVKKALEKEGIIVVDSVKFNAGALKCVVDDLARIAKPSTSLEEHLSQLVRSLEERGLKIMPQKLVELALRYVGENAEDFASWLSRSVS